MPRRIPAHDCGALHKAPHGNDTPPSFIQFVLSKCMCSRVNIITSHFAFCHTEPSCPCISRRCISSNLVKSGQIWSNLVKSGQIWSNLVKSGQIWSNLVKSPQISSNLLKSPQISSNLLKSGQISSNLVKSGQIWSNLVKSGHIWSLQHTVLEKPPLQSSQWTKKCGGLLPVNFSASPLSVPFVCPTALRCKLVYMYASDVL